MDRRITLWDTANGAVVQQWVPHDRVREVYALKLAFSPNGRYLASSAWGIDRRTVIWDLSGPLHRVLKGHADTVTLCIWSPQGDVIASGSEDATVRIWDADTFLPLHVLQHAADSTIELIQFSPDGCWLLTGCYPSSHYIWDVASGTGRLLRMFVDPRFAGNPIAATFNPDGTKLAIASPGGVVEILAIEGNECQSGVVLRGGTRNLLGRETSHIMFSPDRKSVV